MKRTSLPLQRRTFIAGLGGAAACTAAARTQQPGRLRRIGVLMYGVATDAENQSYVAAFVNELHRFGWIEGQNLRIDVRWDAGDAGLGRTYAAQLIGLMPDLILAVTTPNLRVVREATSTIPIVFLLVSDPVAQGFIANLRQPGRNMTGFSLYEFSIASKWLGLLKAAAPSVSRVAVLFNPETSPQSRFFLRVIETSAPSLAVQAISLPLRTAAEIEPAVAGFANQPKGGLILTTDNFTQVHQSLIFDLAARNRLPSIGGNLHTAIDGGLLEYNSVVNYVDQFRQAANYVDRILQGENTGDLPVQAPTNYRLVINLKTAKMLSLEIPAAVRAITDEVIE
jgi:putative ABC transport system substrate-binding protein